MVKLSVIIPHLNSISSLIKLLKTIPNTKKIQVIVIDDNSNLEIREEVLKLKSNHKNLEVYINDSSKHGAGICRNIGLKHAIGEWVIFADADDYFLDDFYNVVKDYFDSKNDAIFFSPTSIELDTGNLSKRHLAYTKLIDDYLNNKNFNSELLFRYSFYVPWSKLIRKSLLDKYNISFEEVIASNDLMFSTKLGFHMENFDVSKQVIYCVTRGKGSLTTILSDEVFDTRLNVFIRYYNYLKYNLSKKDFKALNLSGQSYLLKSLNFGIKKTFRVFKDLKRNKVRVIDLKMLNPRLFLNKVKDLQQKKNSMKKYYKKIN
ncbi:glycosyltransferase family 2 protein [Oceanobacillus oncorhynchi]|uniref:glycosyltransferase family 2 protein n=1 Tax=Oceanobacillus oncorhynchi TaxID=545501 RepID=UPI00186858E1|nr:glycosyltransferase family 2 protein [Oceanobacillus oncorhynchi]